jgi:hypothetical protein
VKLLYVEDGGIDSNDPRAEIAIETTEEDGGGQI